MTPIEQNRKRRVTDKAGGLLDVAQQAVRMERIEGEQRLMASQFKQSVDVLTSTLHALQSDTRNVANKISELGSLQGAHDSNRVALDEMKKSMADLNSRLEDWFDDFDQRNQRRWEIYEANRDRWRREHEASNERDKRSLERETRSVRETTIRFAAFGAAVVMLGGTVVGGFIWNINYRFAEGKDDIAEARQATFNNRVKVDSLGSELIDIKLYLARGGRLPVEPYVPQSQRENNGQAAQGQSRK